MENTRQHTELMRIKQAVLQPSETEKKIKDKEDKQLQSSLLQTKVKGYDFNTAPPIEQPCLDYDALLLSFLTSGFQATNFGLAVKQIEAMVREGLVEISSGF